MKTESKRHFVNGGINESPNGKRRRVEVLPPVQQHDGGVEHHPAAIAHAPANEDTAMRFTDVSRSASTARTHPPADNGAEKTSVQSMTGAIPLPLPRAKDQKQASVDPVLKQEVDYTDLWKDIQHPSRSPATKEGDDGDESSSESSEESSILESWSDESVEEGEEPLPSLEVGSEYEGLERLERTLALRKERLKLLCVGQPPAYVRFLLNNEEMAGKIKIAEYKQQHPDENTNDKSDDDATTPPSPSKTISSWLGILQFEWLHTVPCAYVKFTHVLGHTVFYGFVECLCRIFYQNCFHPWMAQSLFDISLIVMGLSLGRFNGSIFGNTSTTNGYHRIKMEMSNRLRIGMFDARFIKRIKGSITDSSFNMFGYYLVSIGTNHFYYNYHYKCMSRHLDWFNGAWARADALVNAERIENQKQWATYVTPDIISSLTDTAMSPTCEGAAKMVQFPILRPLYRFWCTDLTNQYKSVEIVFHGLSLLLAAGLAFRIGSNVIKLCD